LDRIDLDIINKLKKNGRKSFLKIGKEIGISSITVQKRYEKMKEDGIIFGMTTLIDLSKIGYTGKAFLFLKASKEYDKKKMAEVLNQIPNVFLISEIIGAFDMLAMVAFRDIKEIKGVIDKIRLMPYEEKIEISLTDDTSYPLKEEYNNIQLFEPDTDKIS
jgi:DNA-binding Lrp family transcriptional regulator